MGKAAPHAVFCHVAEDLVSVCDAPTGLAGGGGWVPLGDAQGWYARHRWRLGKREVVVVRVTSISTRLKPWREWAAVTVNVPSIVESLACFPWPQRG